MSSPASRGQSARDLSIDHLRALVVLGLIPFHTARLFDSEAWHVKHQAVFPAADALIAGFNIVGMPLLFLLAGMSAYASLGSRGPGRFASERFGRLFIPLLLGMLIVVPPQVYVERLLPLGSLRMSEIGFSGSFLDFYPTFFTSCCYPEGNFSWHHLWFLAYLFVYSLALLPALLLLRRLMQNRTLAPSSLSLIALGLPLLVLELWLRPSFPSTHALIDDWANNAHYLWLILAGAVITASGALAATAADHRRPWLVVALLFSATWLVIDLAQMRAMLPAPAIIVLRTAAEWTSLVAIIGYGRVHLARPLPFLTAFGAIGLLFYIVHQTVIVLFGYWLLDWVDMPLPKFLVIGGLSFVISLAIASAPAKFRTWRLTRTARA